MSHLYWNNCCFELEEKKGGGMKVILLIFSMIMSQLALGEPASVQDRILTIPLGAVMDNSDPAYFTDIQLNYEGNGHFRLIEAQANDLVTIDMVQIAMLESFPVQINVTVTGNKSVPCVELLPPAISRRDNLFVVVLAETRLGPAESCVALLDPFESTFALDAGGLLAGTYTVSVNSQADQTFVLEEDNFPAVF